MDGQLYNSAGFSRRKSHW